jgi:TPR repeat protein
MKTNRLVCLFLLLCGAPVWPSFAEQVATAQRPIAEIKAKAESGEAESQFQLGRRYDKGEGVPRDLVEAAKWYRKAAEQGLAKAQDNLGVCYDRGEGVAQDHAEAAKWFRKAAEQNLPRAQSNLGVCYDHGTGVTRDSAEAV